MRDWMASSAGLISAEGWLCRDEAQVSETKDDGGAPLSLRRRLASGAARDRTNAADKDRRSAASVPTHRTHL